MAATSRVSAWAPLAIPVFRVLWFAQLGSNIGTWMQTVGAQWFLVESAAGATIIALVQTASLAPSMLLSLPAGVLSDSLDRRKLLIGGSIASAAITVGLTVIAAAHGLTPWLLLLFTALIGASSALTAPAWQAIQPELVPREQIAAASGLGGVTVNAARAIGPALAGIVLSAFGTPVVFGINAASFIAAAVALSWWKREPQPGLDDREPFWGALAAGVRYIASAYLIRRILLRSSLFALPASAIWALLPLVAQRLHLDATGYGAMLGALGVGAVVAVFTLPLARAHAKDNVILAASAALYAVGVAGAAFLPFAPALILLVLCGIAWIGTLTVLNASLQLTLPQWVRSRGAAMYILVFMGTMAIGSYLWGALAQVIGTPDTLGITALLLVLVAASVAIWPLHALTGKIDRTFELTWPAPTLVFEPQPTDGPVTIAITYRVLHENVDAFQDAATILRQMRRRTGATRRRLYRSGEDAEAMVETFVVPSWAEYRRAQTKRLTGRDREIRQDVIDLSEGVPTELHLFPPEVHPRRPRLESSKN
ncbi:MAG TPA: MFS transporter [Galbitalea sp.]|jgi:MFS family permease|nr:MFS transporter [Galbitalea sp.]